MRKVLIATTNTGKLREFASAADQFGVTVLPVPGLETIPAAIGMSSRRAILFLLIAFALTACKSGSQPGRIGSNAPDFTIADGQRNVSLHDFRGKVVLLNFWATWCPPCVEEMPSLVQLQHKMNDRVTVLAVSVDIDPNGYGKFLQKHNIDLLTVRDPDQKSNALYGTFKFPETYVIDREGKIRRKFIGAVNWNDPEIVQYLGSL